MSDNAQTGLMIAGLCLLIVLFLGLVGVSEHNINQGRQQCLNEGQSRWVCDAWASSQRAERDAAFATGVAIGSASGSRR